VFVWNGLLIPFCAIAREASKQIVNDLLLTAGGNLTEDFENEEDSPSVVRRAGGLADDTF